MEDLGKGTYDGYRLVGVDVTDGYAVRLSFQNPDDPDKFVLVGIVEGGAEGALEDIDVKEWTRLPLEVQKKLGMLTDVEIKDMQKQYERLKELFSPGG